MNLLLLLTLMVVMEVRSYNAPWWLKWKCELHCRPNYLSANATNTLFGDDYKWWFCGGGFQVVAATNSHSGGEWQQPCWWQQRQWHWHRKQQWQCLPHVLLYKWWDGDSFYSHAGKKQLRMCDTPCKKKKIVHAKARVHNSLLTSCIWSSIQRQQWYKLQKTILITW